MRTCLNKILHLEQTWEQINQDLRLQCEATHLCAYGKHKLDPGFFTTKQKLQRGHKVRRKMWWGYWAHRGRQWLIDLTNIHCISVWNFQRIKIFLKRSEGSDLKCIDSVHSRDKDKDNTVLNEGEIKSISSKIRNESSLATWSSFVRCRPSKRKKPRVTYRKDANHSFL